MKASRASADANAVMSTSAVMADLPGKNRPYGQRNRVENNHVM